MELWWRELEIALQQYTASLVEPEAELRGDSAREAVGRHVIIVARCMAHLHSSIGFGCTV